MSPEPKSLILYAGFFYVRYSVSYRDLREIMDERGVQVDRATLNRCVVRYSPQIAAWALRRKQPTLGSWFLRDLYKSQREMDLSVSGRGS